MKVEYIQHRGGAVLVSCGADGTARVWHLNFGTCTHVLPHETLTADDDSDVDDDEEKQQQSTDGGNQPPVTVNDCISDGSDGVFTCATDGLVRHFSLVTGELLDVFAGAPDGVNAIALGGPSAEPRIFGGCSNGAVVSWSCLRPHLPPMQLASPHNASVNHIKKVHRQQSIVSADAGGGVAVWNSQTCELKSSLRPHADAVNTMTVDDFHAFTAGRDGVVAKIDVLTGEIKAKWYGSTSSVRAVASGRDRVVTGGKDKTLRCHDTGTGELLWAWDGHPDYLNTILVQETATLSQKQRRKEMETNQLLRQIQIEETPGSKKPSQQLQIGGIGDAPVELQRHLRRRYVHKVAARDKESRVYSAGRDGVIRCSRLSDGQLLVLHRLTWPL
ncbi:MAG: hypothetical protein MHM6MM_008542 [Cercozoa sp. M6MM]